MSTFFKRDLPTLVIAIFGFIIVAEWFLPLKIDGRSYLTEIKTFLGTYSSIMASGAFGIGWVYAITSEYYMLRRNRNWQQYVVSGSFFGMIVIMSFVVFAYGFPGAVTKPEYRWFMLNIYSWQSQAQYGILFLYQCGAVYRVLRLRSMETIVLSICGLAFILRSIPLFVATIPGMMEFGNWVAGAPVLAGTRAATLTSSLGGLVVGLRALIGKESTVIEVR